MTYEEFVRRQIAAGKNAEDIEKGVLAALRSITGRCAFCGVLRSGAIGRLVMERARQVRQKYG